MEALRVHRYKKTDAVVSVMFAINFHILLAVLRTSVPYLFFIYMKLVTK